MSEPGNVASVDACRVKAALGDSHKHTRDGRFCYWRFNARGEWAIRDTRSGRMVTTSSERKALTWIKAARCFAAGV